MNSTKHILIVGGTGMLRDTTTHFIEQGNIVSVLARNEERLKSLKKEYPIKKGRIWTISQDYRDTKKAMKKVRKAADMFIHIDLAVLWIHNTGRKFSNRVKEFLFAHHPKTKVYQLWGSCTDNPKKLSQASWKCDIQTGIVKFFWATIEVTLHRAGSQTTKFLREQFRLLKWIKKKKL